MPTSCLGLVEMHVYKEAWNGRRSRKIGRAWEWHRAEFAQVLWLLVYDISLSFIYNRAILKRLHSITPVRQLSPEPRLPLGSISLDS